MKHYIKSLFKSNWSKWYPLKSFVHDWYGYIIYGKINHETGLVKFKTLSVSKQFDNSAECDIKFEEEFPKLLKIKP